MKKRTIFIIGVVALLVAIVMFKKQLKEPDELITYGLPEVELVNGVIE